MNEIKAVEITSLEQHEQRILAECRVQAHSLIETGRCLKVIKDGEEFAVRGFSSFAEYMEDACGKIFPFKASQAYKYIRVYESYGPRLEQYSGISLDILDMFKNENPDDFAETAEKNDLEHMSVKEAAELKRQLEKATEQLSLLTEEKEAAEAELKELKSKPVDVAVAEPGEAIKKEIAAEIEKKYKAEIKELKNRASGAEKTLLKKEKAIEEEKQNISDGYEKKLRALDEKLTSEKASADERVKALEKKLEAASGKADEELIEFKFYFTQVQENLRKVTSLDPEEYGKLLAGLAKDANGNARSIDNVVLICNPFDYFEKLMPATTVRGVDGTYRNNIMPFPTEIVQSAALKKGFAVIGLAREYCCCVGAGKNGRLEYDDSYKFLEDMRTYAMKLTAYGKANDNNAFALLDISALKPASLRVQVIKDAAAGE